MRTGWGLRDGIWPRQVGSLGSNGPLLYRLGAYLARGSDTAFENEITNDLHPRSASSTS